MKNYHFNIMLIVIDLVVLAVALKSTSIIFLKRFLINYSIIQDGVTFFIFMNFNFIEMNPFEFDFISST